MLFSTTSGMVEEVGGIYCDAFCTTCTGGNLYCIKLKQTNQASGAELLKLLNENRSKWLNVGGKDAPSHLDVGGQQQHDKPLPRLTELGERHRQSRLQTAEWMVAFRTFFNGDTFSEVASLYRFAEFLFKRKDLHRQKMSNASFCWTDFMKDGHDDPENLSCAK